MDKKQIEDAIIEQMHESHVNNSERPDLFDDPNGMVILSLLCLAERLGLDKERIFRAAAQNIKEYFTANRSG